MYRTARQCGRNAIRYTVVQWNLSITALRIKDTSVIRTAIDGPKLSTIETCTYFTSELRTPLFRVHVYVQWTLYSTCMYSGR